MNLTRKKRRLTIAAFLSAVSLVAAVACHAQRNGQDIRFFYDGNGAIEQAWLTEAPAFGSNPAWEGVSNIYYDVNANCGPGGNLASGSWGTVDTDHTDNASSSDDSRANTTPPDSTMVNCALADSQDDPEDEDDPFWMVCDDGFAGDNDCQDPDGSSNYVLMSNETAYYLSAFDTYAEMENLLENVRDVMAGTIVDDDGPGNPTPSSPHTASCIQLRTDAGGPFPVDSGGGETSAARSICPN